MAGWNLTGNAVSAEFDGSDEQERKELSVSQAVEIAAGALDAIPQLSVLAEVTGFRGPNARSGHCYFQGPRARRCRIRRWIRGNSHSSLKTRSLRARQSGNLPFNRRA